MSYRMVITALGRAKLALAIANKTPLNLSIVAVGDGAGVAIEPSETQSGLVREVYRAQINRLDTDPQNPAYAVLEFIIPTDAGGWTVREIGVFDNAGDLVAVGNFAPTYKPLAAEGSTREMVIKVILEVGAPDAVELRIDSSVVLASRAYVDEKTNLANLLPGGLAGEALVKKSNQDGDVEWQNFGDGIPVLVDAKEERQTLAAGQVTVRLNTISTAGVAVYIDGKRIPNFDGEGTANAAPYFEVVNDTDIKLTPAATANQVMLAVRNNPAGALGFLSKQNHLADLPDKSKARENLGIGDLALKKLIADTMFPVGTIYHTTSAANPGTTFGVGTWEKYAVGKMLVGFNAGDADFNAVGKTAGAKIHTLTVNNLPAHTHGVPGQTVNTGSAGAHAHSTAPATAVAASAGAHGHRIFADTSASRTTNNYGLTTPGRTGGLAGLEISAGYVAANTDNTPIVEKDGAHTHSVAIPALTVQSAGAHTHSVTINATATGTAGGNQAVNHMPPYQVVHIWRRTA